MMEKFYLASPLFTEYERNRVAEVAKYWREVQGAEVYVPMEHSIENAWDYSNAEWAKMVFDEDVKAIREADAVLCIYYGLYSDSGTAWECGFAYGIGKPVILLDEAGSEVSLMMVQSCENPNTKCWLDKNQT